MCTSASATLADEEDHATPASPFDHDTFLAVEPGAFVIGRSHGAAIPQPWSVVGSIEGREDEELLVAAAGGDGRAYASFYRRFERAVLSYFGRAGAAPDVRADLTAETFARALAGLDRFDPALGRPTAWLFGIARHVLLASYERGRVESVARQRLAMPPLLLDDEAIERIDDASAAGVVLELLQTLPAEQRAAIEARVVSERDYADIARDLQCSEQVVRKRVSRGLATLRHQLEEKP